MIHFLCSLLVQLTLRILGNQNLTVCASQYFQLLRGSVYERLKWTFKLYDLNGDGCISRGELAEVVQAVHELMGKRIPEDDKKTRDQVSARMVSGDRYHY